MRGARSASAAIRTRSSTRIAELRQLEWSQRLARQARNVLAGEGLPVGLALYTGAARGGAQALARRAGVIAPGAAPTSSCSTRDDPALAGQPRRRAARRGDLRALPATGARRHGRRPMGRPRRQASARRRGARALPGGARAACPGEHAMTPAFDLLITGAHLATMADDDRLRHRPRRRARHRRRADRVGGRGARPAERRDRAAAAGGSGCVGDAGPRRLPHAPRLCRQSGERIRGAPAWRDVRGDRGGRRRNSGDRRCDTRRGRRRARRDEPARGSRRWRPKG